MKGIKPSNFQTAVLFCTAILLIWLAKAGGAA